MSKKIKNEPNKEEIDGFIKIINEMLALKKLKAGDYGNGWKVFGVQGLYYQLGRKFSRIWLNKDKGLEELNCEMMRDSLMDNAVYSIMIIQLLDSGETKDQVDELLKGIKS